MRDRNRHTDRAIKLLDLLQDAATDIETKEDIRAWFWGRGSGYAKDAALAEHIERLVPNPHPDESDHRKYAELAARLNLGDAPTVSLQKKRSTPLIRVAMRAAAILVLALAIPGGVYMLLDKFRSAAVEPSVAAVTVSAASEARTIMLPDGTKVELEAGSEITYNEDFISDRRMNLDGEALLTVVKSTNEAGEPMPFVLTTDNIEVNVHGTVLRVADFCDKGGEGEREHSTVSLYNGSVSVTAGYATITLSQGERYRYCKTTKESNVALLLAHEMLAHGFMPLLRFEESTLDNLLTALTANHKVEFVLNNDADTSKGRFSGDFQSEDLKNTLNILAKSNMINSFELSGDKVIINKK